LKRNLSSLQTQRDSFIITKKVEKTATIEKTMETEKRAQECQREARKGEKEKTFQKVSGKEGNKGKGPKAGQREKKKIAKGQVSLTKERTTLESVSLNKKKGRRKHGNSIGGKKKTKNLPNKRQMPTK